MSQRTSRTSLVLAAVALLASTAASAAFDGSRDRNAANAPVAAVRDFITDGVVDHNGYEACGYLTLEQQRAASRRVGEDECREAFDQARLTLGRHHIRTVDQVERLSASATVERNRASVRLSRDGASVKFRLVKANAAEQQQFLAPDTEWRIARGGLAVVPPANAAHR